MIVGFCVLLIVILKDIDGYIPFTQIDKQRMQFGVIKKKKRLVGKT